MFKSAWGKLKSVAWYDKGTALCELGRYEEAIPCFDEAIRLNPNHADAWNNKGVELCELKRYEEAIPCYDEAIRLKPDYAMVWNNKGILILKQGLESITSRNMKEAEERALELAQLRKGTEKDKMAQVVDKAVLEFKEGLSKEELKSFNGFEEILSRFKGKKP